LLSLVSELTGKALSHDINPDGISTRTKAKTSPFGLKNRNSSRVQKIKNCFFSGAQRNGVFAFIDFKAWNAAYGLVMTDGSLLTIRQHQQQTQILEKIEINERVFMVFVNIQNSNQ